MNKVIVIGDNHHNTLGVVRSIGESGIPVECVVLSLKKSFIEGSKYIKKVHYIKPSVDELRTLLISKRFINEKSVIIPTCDRAALLLDAVYKEFEQKYYMPYVDKCPEGLVACEDKEYMNRIAEKCGFNVAHCVAITFDSGKKGEEIKKDLEHGMVEFPVILKPLKSVYGNKKQIKVCDTLDELVYTLLECGNGKYLVQRYVNIDEEVGIQGVSLFGSDKVVIPGVIHKIRQSLSAKGSTTYGRLDDMFNGIQISKLERLISEIGFHGIFDVELIKSADKYYFIEANLRNGAYGYAYTKAGVNLVKVWYESCINKEIDINNVCPVYFMNEFADFSHVKNRTIKIFPWIKQFIEAKAKGVFSIHDPMPFFLRILYR